MIGDVVGNPPLGVNFEILSLTWGPAGVTLHRTPYSGVTSLVGVNNSITSVTSAPGVTALSIGGAGILGRLFHGDLLELQAYDTQLSSAERVQLETELYARWLIPEPSGGLLILAGLAGLSFLKVRGYPKKETGSWRGE